MPDLVYHNTKEEALQEIANGIDEAAKRGRFLIAVWSVNANNRLEMVRRTSYEFPVDDVPTATEMLRQSFREEVGSVAPPLPMAARLNLQEATETTNEIVETTNEIVETIDEATAIDEATTKAGDTDASE